MRISQGLDVLLLYLYFQLQIDNELSLLLSLPLLRYGLSVRYTCTFTCELESRKRRELDRDGYIGKSATHAATMLSSIKVLLHVAPLFYTGAKLTSPTTSNKVRCARERVLSLALTTLRVFSLSIFCSLAALNSRLFTVIRNKKNNR